MEPLDELVVILSLDSSKYTEGMKQAQKSIEDMQNVVMRSANGMSESIIGVVGKIGAMVLGFKGLESVVSLVKTTANEMKQLGIMAEIAGASVHDMRIMQEYSELAGAGPNATSDFSMQLQQQMFGMTWGQIPMPWLMNAVLPGFDVTRWAWNPNQKEKWTQLQQALTAPGVGERLSAQIPGNPSPRQAEMAAAMGMGMPQPLAENLTNPQEFNKAMQTATKTNKDMNEQVAKNARAAADAMIDLKYAVEDQATKGFPLLTMATMLARDSVGLFGDALDDVTKLLDSLIDSPFAKWIEKEFAQHKPGDTSGFFGWGGRTFNDIAEMSHGELVSDVFAAPDNPVTAIAEGILGSTTSVAAIRGMDLLKGVGLPPIGPALAPIAMPSLPIVSLPGSLIGPGGQSGTNNSFSIANMQINTGARNGEALMADIQRGSLRKFNVSLADGGVVV